MCRCRGGPSYTRTAVPEITTATAHLRDVLGDQTYESLARKGETMTTAAMVAYAYDQIDQARSELNAVSESSYSWRIPKPYASASCTAARSGLDVSDSASGIRRKWQCDTPHPA